MQQKRRAWTRTIEKAKAAHWKEFLDQAGKGHLWKAASYITLSSSYANIPSLTVGNKEVSDNHAKARTFLHTFFPEMVKPIEESIAPQRPEIPWEPLTKQEIY
jgi:hypothetical protein